MNLRLRLARALLPPHYVVIFREDWEEARDLAFTCHERLPLAVNWTRVYHCLDRAEERCG